MKALMPETDVRNKIFTINDSMDSTEKLGTIGTCWRPDIPRYMNGWPPSGGPDSTRLQQIKGITDTLLMSDWGGHRQIESGFVILSILYLFGP
jgi:hypothetical protein